MGSEDLAVVSRPKVISVLRRSFGALNAPGGRYLTVDNVHQVLHPFGLKEDEGILDTIQQAYLRDDGRICYEDFDKVLVKQLEGLEEPVEECIKNAFNLLDYDKNGYVTIPELFHLFGEVGEMWSDQDLYEVVKACDIDGDGRLDLEDFFQFLGYSLSGEVLTEAEDVDKNHTVEESGSLWPPTIEKIQQSHDQTKNGGHGDKPLSSSMKGAGNRPEGESLITIIHEAEDAGLLQYSSQSRKSGIPLESVLTEEEVSNLLSIVPNCTRQRSRSLVSADSSSLAIKRESLKHYPLSSSMLLDNKGKNTTLKNSEEHRRHSLYSQELSALIQVQKLESTLKRNNNNRTDNSSNSSSRRPSCVGVQPIVDKMSQSRRNSNDIVDNTDLAETQGSRIKETVGSKPSKSHQSMSQEKEKKEDVQAVLVDTDGDKQVDERLSAPEKECDDQSGRLSPENNKYLSEATESSENYIENIGKVSVDKLDSSETIQSCRNHVRTASSNKLSSHQTEERPGNIRSADFSAELVFCNKNFPSSRETTANSSLSDYSEFHRSAGQDDGLETPSANKNEEKIDPMVDPHLLQATEECQAISSHSNGEISSKSFTASWVHPPKEDLRLDSVCQQLTSSAEGRRLSSPSTATLITDVCDSPHGNNQGVTTDKSGAFSQSRKQGLYGTSLSTKVSPVPHMSSPAMSEIPHSFALLVSSDISSSPILEDNNSSVRRPGDDLTDNSSIAFMSKNQTKHGRSKSVISTDSSPESIRSTSTPVSPCLRSVASGEDHVSSHLSMKLDVLNPSQIQNSVLRPISSETIETSDAQNTMPLQLPSQHGSSGIPEKHNPVRRHNIVSTSTPSSETVSIERCSPTRKAATPSQKLQFRQDRIESASRRVVRKESGDSLPSADMSDTLDSETLPSRRSSPTDSDNFNTIHCDIRTFAKNVEHALRNGFQIGKIGHGDTEHLEEVEKFDENHDQTTDKDSDFYLENNWPHNNKDVITDFSCDDDKLAVSESTPDSGFVEQTFRSLIQQIDKQLVPRKPRIASSMSPNNSPTKEKGNIQPTTLQKLRANERHAPRPLGRLPPRLNLATSKSTPQRKSLNRQNHQRRCFGFGIMLPGCKVDNSMDYSFQKKSIFQTTKNATYPQKKVMELSVNVLRTKEAKPPVRLARQQITLSLNHAKSRDNLLRYESVSRSMAQNTNPHPGRVCQKPSRKQGVLQQTVVQLKLPDVSRKPPPKKLSLLSSLPDRLGKSYYQ